MLPTAQQTQQHWLHLDQGLILLQHIVTPWFMAAIVIGIYPRATS